MKLKILLLSGLLFSFSQMAVANTQAVYKTVNNHLATVACDVEIEKDHVFLVESSEYSKQYYVLWSGDMGCLGGSGTMGYHVTAVSENHRGNLLVDNHEAFGQEVMDGINFRFIDSIKMVNANTFKIVSWDYADAIYGGNDAGNNFPANKFQYIINRPAAYESWSVIDKRLISRR